MKYLIWSEEHSAWWNPRSAGYTNKITRAGIYDEDEAKSIVESANHGDLTFNEIAIPVPEDLEQKKQFKHRGR